MEKFQIEIWRWIMTHFMPLIFDLIPLLIFVILDSLGKMRYALIGAVTAAGFEIGYSYFAMGSIDSFSLIFAGTILLFASLSYYFNNSIFFRLKPAIIGGITGMIVVVTSMMGEPVLLSMADRYSTHLPENMSHTLQNQYVRDQFTNINHYMGFGLIIHSILTTWAAIYTGRWIWFFVSVPGLYVTIALCVWVGLKN
jgi:intracellular septation protein A